jgi:transposase
VQPQPTYEQLATLVVRQAAVIESLQARVVLLENEVVSLRRQLGRDSSNSSQPPSQDGPAAKARQKSAARDQAGDGQRPARRRQGGQKGHPGTGLRRVAVPDRQEAVEPPACSGCGAGLAGTPGHVASSVQVFDLPAFAVTVTEYLMMSRVCGCGHATTAAPPPDVSGGPVCYGPNVVAAATFLASQDVIGIERAADLMSALLGVPVSTGFVSRCLARLDDALTAAGFEDALKAALREAEVLGTDETPAPVTASGVAAETAATGQEISNPHVFTVRTLRSCTTGGPDLVWFGAAGTRTKKALRAFGILDDYAGVLVRDDFGGYLSYDSDLAGVQQCLSHMLRHLQDAHDIDPATQVWTVQATAALQAAIHATNHARRTGADLDTDIIATARSSFDQAVACGISINLSRPWPKGNHPGLVLAKRLQRKADQVWLFTTRDDVPPTNNGSEAAIRGFKLAEKVSGCWRTLATLQRHCRIRSYLETARNHAHRPLDAIRDALTGTTWTPPRITADALAA